MEFLKLQYHEFGIDCLYKYIHQQQQSHLVIHHNSKPGQYRHCRKNELGQQNQIQRFAPYDHSPNRSYLHP
ncbi:MAG TPA: hypothetical protein [Caudoviricetes sp.]|nr:MAG TPA: hypothetical protein [Caudoviricetes sp.]